MDSINYIQILGERNSGTNYLQHLLASNIPDIEVGQKYIWKHGRVNHKRLQAIGIKRVLFLAIFKDPYSWFVSMNGKPWHAPHLSNLPFSDFIRHEWSCWRGRDRDYDQRKVTHAPQTEDEEMMWERDPITNQRFENVVMLRNVKNRSYLTMETFANYFKQVKYEDLLQNPAAVIREIVHQFNLPLNPDFKHTDQHHGKCSDKVFDKKDYYLRKLYFKHYTQEDLDFVNSCLIEKQEKAIGYGMVRHLPEFADIYTNTLRMENVINPEYLTVPIISIENYESEEYKFSTSRQFYPSVQP